VGAPVRSSEFLLQVSEPPGVARDEALPASAPAASVVPAWLAVQAVVPALALVAGPGAAAVVAASVVPASPAD
jgi:hypothetical protein